MEDDMPPKVRITKEEIIRTALDLVRQSGAEAINARAIANALLCSTQPIFSNFETMEELENATLAAAHTGTSAVPILSVDGSRRVKTAASSMSGF